MHVSFITRKGWWGRFTPVSWLASQDVSFRPASGYYNRPSQVLPSGQSRCPRLQLRGSAGFAPASHSPAWGWSTIMREPNFEKEQKQQLANLPGTAWQSQTGVLAGSVPAERQRWAGIRGPPQAGVSSTTKRHE